MSKGLAFWIVFLIAVIAYCWLSWPIGPASGAVLGLFILFGLLGWKVFGPAIKE